MHQRTSAYGVALAGMALLALLACGSSSEKDNTALRERLAYLSNLAEVEWVDFDGGNVYVGFGRRPPDLATVINTAAAVANKAHGSTVHVWAVAGGEPGWRPGDGETYCHVTARMGMIEQPCM